MLGRQSRPMEKSSPAFVFMPLWQATQRSEVRNSGVDDELPITSVHPGSQKQSNSVRTAIEPHNESSALPALVKLSVDPVPKDVEDNLALPACALVNGFAIAEIYRGMCCLRLMVTCICGTTSQFVRCSSPPDRERRRTRPSASTSGPSRDRQQGSARHAVRQKSRLRRDVGMTRQIGASLELYKRVGGKELVESGEGLKRRGARAESAGPVAAGHDHARQTGSGSIRSAGSTTSRV